MKKYDIYVGGYFVGTKELSCDDVKRINNDSSITLITK